MYSIKKDKIRPGKILIRYCLSTDLTKQVFEIENADILFTEGLIRRMIEDVDDLPWILRKLEIENKLIQVLDTGKWNVL
jgi:hypothetical protein